MNDTQRKLSRVEKIGAERLTASYQTVPHFTVAMEMEVDRLLALKRELSGKPEYHDVPPSVTAMLMQGVAACLRRHDHLNASFEAPDTVLLHAEVSIGVAVDTPRGLVVPVIKQADRLSLPELCGLLRQLTDRARSGRLSLEDITGGTFTISNLGMMGVDWFTAIINPPQSAILATGAIVRKPVAAERRGRGAIGDDHDAHLRPSGGRWGKGGPFSGRRQVRRGG